MKKTKMILGLSTLALSLAANAGNYKLCNKVLNPYQDFGDSGGQGSYGGVGMGMGFGFGLNPYTIENDGKVKPAKGIKEYRFDKEKNQEIIEYEVPTFPYDIEPGEQPDFSQMKPVMKKQMVIIQRDKNNEISKITNDFNVKQSELDKHNKMMKKWYEYTYSDKYKEQMKKIQQQWNLEEFQTPIMLPLKSETHLSMINGKCRVDRSNTTHLMDNKLKDGFKYETINSDTKLCKDLGKVIKKHQDKLKKCFSYDVEKDLEKVTKDFYKNTGRENPMQTYGGGIGFGGGFGIGMGTYPGMGGGIGGGFGMGGFGMGMGYPGFGMTLENQVANLAFKNPMMSNPPIVQANQMYETCRFQGLTAFEGEEFWPKAIPKSPPHGDDGAGNNGGDASEQ